jgi:hypothetical protein
MARSSVSRRNVLSGFSEYTLGSPTHALLKGYGSRVDRFLPILRVEVCFLCLPPGFPTVPHYFNPVPVCCWPRPLTEPDVQISCIRLFSQVHKSAILDSRFSSVDNAFPGSVPCIVSPLRYTCLSIPSLHRHCPASLVLWIDPTTCTPSSNLVASVPSTPFQRKIQVLPGS